MYGGEVACNIGGRTMAEKDKGALTSFEVEIAKNGFEIRARYAPKKTLSQTLVKRRVGFLNHIANLINR
jgi:hypothetical protein